MQQTDRSLRATAAALTTVLTALLAPASAAQLRGIETRAERRQCGVFLWDGERSPGAFTIQFGQPPWRPEYDELIERRTSAQVRLGKDHWTTLDSSVDLTIGGVAVGAGQHFLGLGITDDGGFELLVFDARRLLLRNANPGQTAELAPQVRCPLVHGKVDDEVRLLVVDVAVDADRPTHGELRLSWGRHRLTAAIVAVVARTAPVDEVRKAMRDMAALLDDGDLRRLVETFAPPGVIDREGGIDAIVDDFSESDQRALRRALDVALGLEPETSEDGDEVVFRHDSFPRELRFKKIDGRWRLDG